MRVLGIDPGSRHLGLCLVETHPTIAIEDWRVLDVGSTAAEFVRAMRDALPTVPDRAVIERQHPRNAIVQHRLETYLAMVGCPHVTVQDARVKLRVARASPWWPDGVLPRTYAERKRASVRAAQAFVRAHGIPNEAFECAKKKDDLADALLLALTQI